MSRFTVVDMTTIDQINERSVTQMPWGRLLLLSTAAFATVTVELFPASVLLDISADLNVSTATAGLLVSAWALTVAFTSPVIVRRTSHIQRNKILISALVVASVATLATALAPDYWVALTTRVVGASAHGVFWSLLIPTVTSMVSEKHAGRAVSIVLAGPSMASVVGIPAGAAIANAIGWRQAFAVAAAIVAVTVLAVRRMPSPVNVDEMNLEKPPRLGKTTVLIAASSGLVLSGHFVLYTYIAPLLENVGHFDAANRAAMLLAFGIAGVVGTLLSGIVSDRLPFTALIWTCSGFFISALSLALIDRGVGTALIIVAFWGVLIGLLPPVFQLRLMRSVVSGQERSAGAMGIAVLNVGIASGAIVGSIATRIVGVDDLSLIAAALIAVGVGVQIFVVKGKTSEDTLKQGSKNL